MGLSFDENLLNEIKIAIRLALNDLFKIKEDFYYFSLITTGEANAPILVAWSLEALNQMLEAKGLGEESRLQFKWSYADSPYFDFGSIYFEEVRRLFSNRPSMTFSMSDQEWEKEFNCRLQTMERAIADLDEEGVFGGGLNRLRVVVNVEVMPPDYGNTLRAKRLNPPQALRVWLEEAAENS